MRNNNSLWMGDIEPWMDELFIKNAFKQHGFNPKSIKIFNNNDLSNYRGFCFVTFNSSKEANDALFNLNEKKMANTNTLFRLNLSKYSINSKKYKNYKNVYVGNLSPKLTELELYNTFKSKYPSVYYACIIQENGISRGYGFVHFANEDEYNSCLKEMNGIFLHNRIIRVKEKNNDKELSKNNFRRNNYIKKKYFKDKIEEDKFFIDKKKNNIKIIENHKEKDLPNNSMDLESKIFIKNIELLESDNIEELFDKIRESVDKMVEYFINFQNINEISKLILYYSSYCK